MATEPRLPGHPEPRVVDAASCAAFRILLGTLVAASAARSLANGWVSEMYERPRFFFPFEAFAWLRAFPAPGMQILYAALVALGVCVAAGFFFRISALCLFLGFSYAQLLDRTNYLNHNYLLCCLALLAWLLPLEQCWSADAWRKPALRSRWIPIWAPRVLRLQLAVVYLFGGLGKLRPDWLLEAQPLRLWLSARADTPFIGDLLTSAITAHVFSVAGLVFDLAIVPCLLWRPTRSVAYGVLLLFHGLTWALFPIGMFPWIMVLLTPIFFEPDWPRRVLIRTGLSREARIEATGPGPVSCRNTRRSRLRETAIMVHVAIQLALPLRQLPSWTETPWHEHGFRFSWNIMLVEKTGHAAFRVLEPGGHETSVDPLDELTPLQARMMATQPDMIVWYARHLAEERRLLDGRDREVRTDAWVSLNGRRRARIIDPTIDLAHLPRGLPVSQLVPSHP